MKEQIIPGGNTQFSYAGKGEPLIFIHGVGLDHNMWISQISYFSKLYTVYAIDMLGHGKSERLHQENVTLDDFIKQLYEFYTALNIDSAHVVGFSMGGMVAQYFAICYPERVKTLTIANAVANRTDEEAHEIGRAHV